MATAIAEQPVNGPYILETATQFTTVTMTASDPTNMNGVVMTTGRSLLIFQNSHGATPFWITVFSSGDPHGRTGDITQESKAAGVWCAHFFEGPGWEQSLGGRDLLIDTENTAIKILAIPV